MSEKTEVRTLFCHTAVGSGSGSVRKIPEVGFLIGCI